LLRFRLGAAAIERQAQRRHVEIVKLRDFAQPSIAAGMASVAVSAAPPLVRFPMHTVHRVHLFASDEEHAAGRDV
jgi:hypothetical protein